MPKSRSKSPAAHAPAKSRNAANASSATKAINESIAKSPNRSVKQQKHTLNDASASLATSVVGLQVLSVALFLAFHLLTAKLIKEDDAQKLLVQVAAISVLAGLPKLVLKANSLGNPKIVTACMIIACFAVSDALSVLQALGFKLPFTTSLSPPISSSFEFWTCLWSASLGLIMTMRLPWLFSSSGGSVYFALVWAGSTFLLSTVEFLSACIHFRPLDLVESMFELITVAIVAHFAMTQPRHKGYGERIRAVSAGSDVALIVYHLAAFIACVTRVLVVTDSKTKFAKDWALLVEPKLASPTPVPLTLFVHTAFWTVGSWHLVSLGEIFYRIGAGRRGILGNHGLEWATLFHGFYLGFCFVLVGVQSIEWNKNHVLTLLHPSQETTLLATACITGSLLHVVHWVSDLDESLD